MHLMAGGRAGHLLIQRNCWLLARKGHGGAWKRSPPSKSSMEEGRRLLLHRHSTSTRQFLHLRTKCHLGAPPAFWEGPFSGPDQSPTYSGSWLAVFALVPTGLVSRLCSGCHAQHPAPRSSQATHSMQTYGRPTAQHSAGKRDSAGQLGGLRCGPLGVCPSLPSTALSPTVPRMHCPI